MECLYRHRKRQIPLHMKVCLKLVEENQYDQIITESRYKQSR